MTCERWQGLLAARLYEPLASDEAQALDAHLASCPACRSLAEGWEADPLPRLNLERAPSFWVQQKAAVMARLDRPAPSRLRWSLAPALALALFAVVWYGKQPASVPAPALPINEEVLNEDLDFVQNIEMVEEMDVLEELDALETV